MSHENILISVHCGTPGRVLDAKPTSKFTLMGGYWDAEKQRVLANRPYRLNLQLGSLGTGHGVALEAGGMTFIEELERRQCCFGSLHVDYRDRYMPFIVSHNLERFN